MGRVEVADLVMEHPGRELPAGLVEVVRQLVADRLLVLDVLVLGALLLAGGALGLVVRRVGALDGLVEPRERRRDMRAGALLERLGRDVLVRALCNSAAGEWLGCARSGVPLCAHGALAHASA